MAVEDEGMKLEAWLVEDAAPDAPASIERHEPTETSLHRFLAHPGAPNVEAREEARHEHHIARLCRLRQCVHLPRTGGDEDLAEDVFTSLHGRQGDLGMSIDFGDDVHRVDVRCRQERLRVGVRAGLAAGGGDLANSFLGARADANQIDVRQLRQHPGVQGPEPAESNDARS